MKRAELLRSGILAMALTAAGLAAAGARADVITLDVSGTLTSSSIAAACSPTCTVGGDIVINNSSGAANSGFVSADVTASGFSPSVGPFTNLFSINASSTPNTELRLEDAASPFVDTLNLFIDTPAAGSLIGYTGGPIGLNSFVNDGETGGRWVFTSGSLTEAVPAPLIGRGLPAVLAFAGVLFGAKLLERSGKRRSFPTPGVRLEGCVLGPRVCRLTGGGKSR
jgi:hypothetical protein